MAKNMTLRLTDEQAAELEAVAFVESRPIADVVRQAIADLIDARRGDEEFQKRLQASFQHHRAMLARLASEAPLGEGQVTRDDILEALDEGRRR